MLITDTEFAPVVAQALAQLEQKPIVIDIADASGPGGERLGEMGYEEFLTTGDSAFPEVTPEDEWDAIALNYTSGTTGNPKGVVYHHRGAYLNALGNVLVWGMRQHPVYLWTLPMFHCNGWCFPWTITAMAGTHVCLRRVEAAAIYEAIARDGVTHLCGAPVVMNMLLNAGPGLRRSLDRRIEMMTAGAPPPAAVIEGMEALGFHITHVYGLTECYGPGVVCAWHERVGRTARRRARAAQGAAGCHLSGPGGADGRRSGDSRADRGRWRNNGRGGDARQHCHEGVPEEPARHRGGVRRRLVPFGRPRGHAFRRLYRAEGPLERHHHLGGENISTIEVEDVLYRHPGVLEAAVVARPDPMWGETPCAFVTLKPEATATAEEIIAFCRDHLARFKVPRTVLFGPLPKTSTGKIQKFVLRERAKENV